MRKSPTIRLADPKEDRARPESIAMIAVAAWGVGFALMLGVAKLMPKYSALEPSTVIAARAQLPLNEPEPARKVSATRGLETKAAHIVKPAPQQPSAEVLPARAPASDAARAPAPLPAPVPKPTPRIDAPLAASKLPQPTAAALDPKPLAAEPPPAPKKRGAQKRAFSRGVLAYLRCEGSERPHARFPCPRDEKFEEAVWHILEGLTLCETDPGAGGGELRLVLRRSQVSGMEWKAGTSSQGLNVRAIGKCAGAKLAELRTRLRAPESLVSFRFSLE
jgi:hypothetical protein